MIMIDMWIFWTVLLVVVAVLLFLYSCTDNGWRGIAGQFFVWCLLMAVLTVVKNTSEPKPTALDVCRGNTELEITSVNGVLTDTIVVFKNK